MKKLFFFFLLLSVVFSCKKPEKYDIVPKISFVDIPVKDTVDKLGNPIRRCVLTFSLIDGDGNIGFDEEDTISPYQIDGAYYYNLLINMYKIVDGNGLPVDTPEIGTPFRFRTKHIEPIGQNKTLKCTIYVNLDFDIPSSWDTVRFDFFMYDRALNKSNIVSTPTLLMQ